MTDPIYASPITARELKREIESHVGICDKHFWIDSRTGKRMGYGTTGIIGGGVQCIICWRMEHGQGELEDFAITRRTEELKKKEGK